jgi:hypothetical protein
MALEPKQEAQHLQFLIMHVLSICLRMTPCRQNGCCCSVLPVAAVVEKIFVLSIDELKQSRKSLERLVADG